MLSAKEVAALAAKALDAKMGEDIRLIGITDISTLADFFLICTATSSTHVKTGGWCEPGKSTGRLSPLSRRPEGSKDGRMAALKAA